MTLLQFDKKESIATVKMGFDHFILTRFNVQNPNLPPGAGLDPDWLKHRFRLFERFCYPTVRSQIVQDFTWLAFFDAQTPETFRSKIREYSAWDRFVPVYVDAFDRSTAREAVLGRKERRFTISTRLDNDDAICRDFTQMIQSAFHEQEFEFINFPYGFIWHRNRIWLHRSDSNAFISLVERADEPITVFCGNHTSLGKKGAIRQTSSKPAWIQVIHERNVTNTVQGKRYPIRRLGSDFAMDRNSSLVSGWTDGADVVARRILEKLLNTFHVSSKS